MTKAIKTYLLHKKKWKCRRTEEKKKGKKQETKGREYNEKMGEKERGHKKRWMSLER